MVKNVYIAGGARTPFGSFNGVFSNLSAPQLGSHAIRGALSRAGLDARHVDEVIFGNVVQAGVGQNPARQASLGAGIGIDVGAVTVNKVCGSSMRAVIYAAQAIQCDDANVVVAGGCESMSNAPYLLPKARRGYRMGNAEFVDALIHDGLWDIYTDKNMGACGDQCALKYDISREEQDNYSIESYRRAIESWQNGFFKGTVVPVEVKDRKSTILVEKDEDLDKYQGPEKLRALPPAFGKDSRITAGNASNISDGAAAMIVFGDKAKSEYGLKPTARILGHTNHATHSDWFTIAPIYAIQKLCDKLGIKPADVDLFEINEAFAVVTLVAMKELKLDHAKVNVAGGSVAIGHPIGASGARIINTLVRALHLQDKRLGIACLCIGGGEATAIAVERM